MKKFLLSATLFAASAAYVFSQYLGGNTPASTVVASNVETAVTQKPAASTAVAAPASAPAATSGSGSATATTPSSAKPQGQYADGTYTGSGADAYYGTVQVQAVIQDGKIADVTFLQYPNDRRTSQYINSRAMPLLRQEAIQVQSANVSGVSGASDTSAAFRQSLASALSQAKS